MKLTLVLIVTLVLSGVLFALRHRELRALGQEAGVLRLLLATPPSAASSSEKPVTFNARPILAALKGLCSGGTHNEAEWWAVWAKLDGLSIDELRSLCAAARREPSPPPGFLAAVAGAAASALDDKDNALAADFFAAMPQDDPAVVRDLRFRLSDWIEKDPGGVSTWLKRVIATGTVQGSQRRDYERRITQADVMLAPVAQLSFIRSLPEGDQGELLGAGLRRLKSPEDTRAFAAAVISWPAAKPRDYVIRSAMDKLLEHGGFAAAAAWLDALPDATVEQKSDARLALTLAEPQAIAMMPQRAAWILSQADPSDQVSLAVRITESWVGRDYNAAGAWLHQNRTASWFDAAASAFSIAVAGTEPTTGFDWTLAISDEATRRTALQEVMRRWRRDNPTAADDYLMASAVPEEWKAELTRGAASTPSR